MKFVNVILIILIVTIYSLAFVAGGHPIYADPAETEIEETESETEQPYSDSDFYELSHLIQAEAGYCEWDMMIGVGSVVLNRVASDKFPNTVYDVIHQDNPLQYATVYWLDSQVPTEQALEVTDYLLRNGSEYPADVLYQGNVLQGTGIYKTLSTSYSTMYFCYG